MCRARSACELLAANGVGRLAVNGKEAPVIRPVNYLFDEPSQSVVFRTAPGIQVLRAAASAHGRVRG